MHSEKCTRIQARIMLVVFVLFFVVSFMPLSGYSRTDGGMHFALCLSDANMSSDGQSTLSNTPITQVRFLPDLQFAPAEQNYDLLIKSTVVFCMAMLMLSIMLSYAFRKLDILRFDFFRLLI